MQSLQNQLLKALLTAGNAARLLTALTTDVGVIRLVREPLTEWLAEGATSMPQMEDFMFYLLGGMSVDHIPTDDRRRLYIFRWRTASAIIRKYYPQVEARREEPLAFTLPQAATLDDVYADALKLWLCLDHVVGEHTVSYVPSAAFANVPLRDLSRYLTPAQYVATVDTSAQGETRMHYPHQVFDFETWSTVVNTFLRYYPEDEMYEVGVEAEEGEEDQYQFEVSPQSPAAVAEKSFYAVLWVKSGYDEGTRNAVLLSYEAESMTLACFSPYALNQTGWVHATKNATGRLPLLARACSTCAVPVQALHTCSSCNTGVYCSSKCFERRSCGCL